MDRITFARNFYLEEHPRGYVVAGIRGTEIRFLIDMDAGKKEAFSPYEETWRHEMGALKKRAEKRVRKAWKEYSKK